MTYTPVYVNGPVPAGQRAAEKEVDRLTIENLSLHREMRFWKRTSAASLFLVAAWLVSCWLGTGEVMR